jgi:hypothetical protein
MEKGYEKQIEQVKKAIESGTSTKEACKAAGISWQRYAAAVIRPKQRKKCTRQTPVTVLPVPTHTGQSFLFVGNPTQIAEFVKGMQ